MAGWKVLLSPPEVGPVERELLLETFDSGWIAPAGPDLAAFESELASYTGAADVVALSSGTAALHLALQVLGVGPGDDVLMPTLTFAASAFAATYLGARPCFLDVDTTWQLDAALLEDELAGRAREARLPAAVVAVDLYGSVAAMDDIAAICGRFEVPLVEDAAEAIGARLGGISAGRFGTVGILSFNGNKMLTTGGGGALLSDDAALVERCRFLSTQARLPGLFYEHAEVGYNYRLGSLNAAVGRGQLRTLDARIAERARVRATYEARLFQLGGIHFQPSPATCTPNHWLTTVAIDAAVFGAGSPGVIDALHAEQIEARPGFKPMHRQPVFADAPMRNTGRADRLLAECVSLPSSAFLTESDIAWICDVVAGARH